MAKKGIVVLTQEERRMRLQAASQRLGSDKALGQRLGHKSGAVVGHMLSGYRPVTEKTLARLAEIREIADIFADISKSRAAALSGEPVQKNGNGNGNGNGNDGNGVSEESLRLARLFDLIPETDLVSRATAYASASAAIVAVLEGRPANKPAPSAPAVSNQKTQRN